MTIEEQLSTEWVERARELFRAPRPEHFTNFRHCCECAEHDETLLNADIDTIGLAELGNPGWDPICFATPEGKKYYVPAMVRLSLDTLADEFYLAQFLFHLEYDGPGNEFFAACNERQRVFIADFIAHLIEHFPAEIDAGYCSDDALRAHQLWSGG